MRLDNYLLRELRNVPRSHVYRIIRSGEVRVNRGRAGPGRRLDSGDEVRIPPVRVAPRRDPGRPPDSLTRRVTAAVVDEGDDWLLLDKPAGLASHAGSGLRFGAIEVLRAVRDGPYQEDRYLELVHRLDRDTSGCLLMAKNRQALNRLRDAWRRRQVEKRYLALVTGAWTGSERAVDAPLARDRVRGGERMSEVDDAGGKSAQSLFEPVERFADAALLAVTIATGRTHQIRVHAAHIGHPVAGDEKYGERDANRRWRDRGLRRMFLHAWRLHLPATGETWEAPLPAELESILRQLRRT